MLHSNTHIQDSELMYWNADLISMWGTYRIVDCNMCENGTVLRLVPVVLNDRFSPFGFDDWRYTLTNEQMSVLLDPSLGSDSADACRDYIGERAPVLAMIGASPFTFMTECNQLGSLVENKDWSAMLLCLPEPQHHIIPDEDAGLVTRTLNTTHDKNWAVIETCLKSTGTILGNISNIVGESLNGGGAITGPSPSIVGDHPTRWRPVWKDKRKSKRIGMGGDHRRCFHHGFVRCSECNGEVEYCFNRRIETDKFKCPHCSTEDAVNIPDLTPFIGGGKTI